MDSKKIYFESECEKESVCILITISWDWLFGFDEQKDTTFGNQKAVAT